MSAFLALLRRDLTLAFRIGGGGLMGVGFYLLAATLAPIGAGADVAVLARLAPGAVWSAALLANLLSLDRLFQADYEDGALDLLMISPLGGLGVAAAKALAHWITTGLPLIAAAPILAITLNLPLEAWAPLMLGLLIGTPALSLVGATAAALTVGVRRGGLLLSLLVLPLSIPTLVLGARAAARAAEGLDWTAALAAQGAVTLVAAALGPWAAAAALRVNLR